VSRHYRKGFHGQRWKVKAMTTPITGSAVALHCCKAHVKINRKMGNSTPCKTVTPESISPWNFANVIRSARWPIMQILVSIGTVGASPKYAKYYHFVTFLTVLDIYWRENDGRCGVETHLFLNTSFIHVYLCSPLPKPQILCSITATDYHWT